MALLRDLVEFSRWAAQSASSIGYLRLSRSRRWLTRAPEHPLRSSLRRSYLHRLHSDFCITSSHGVCAPFDERQQPAMAGSAAPARRVDSRPRRQSATSDETDGPRLLRRHCELRLCGWQLAAAGDPRFGRRRALARGVHARLARPELRGAYGRAVKRAPRCHGCVALHAAQHERHAPGSNRASPSATWRSRASS